VPQSGKSFLQAVRLLSSAQPRNTTYIRSCFNFNQASAIVTEEKYKLLGGVKKYTNVMKNKLELLTKINGSTKQEVCERFSSKKRVDSNIYRYDKCIFSVIDR